MPKQGIPVVKPLAGPGLQLDVPGGIAEKRTASRQSEGPAIDFKFFSPILTEAEQNQGKTDSDFTKPEVKVSKLTVTGFFRGQIFSVETPVELHPVAGLVAIGPSPADPPDAGVAVKANADIIKKFGQGTGSIAIVLDCSGSMRFNNDKEKTKNEKLTNAKTAITRVLKDVPPGTTVSLWTFSQLPPELATDKDDNALFRSDDPKYQQLQAEPELTIQRLRDPLRWDINQINGLATKLDELRPWFRNAAGRSDGQSRQDGSRQRQGNENPARTHRRRRDPVPQQQGARSRNGAVRPTSHRSLQRFSSRSESR